MSLGSTPHHWQGDGKVPPFRKLVHLQSAEGFSVVDYWKQTGGAHIVGGRVLRVERVENADAGCSSWHQYHAYREGLGRRTIPNERWLWHGTSQDALQAMIDEGKGMNIVAYANKDFNAYGVGNYFAGDVRLSDFFLGDVQKGAERILILCRVAMGRCGPRDRVCPAPQTDKMAWRAALRMAENCEPLQGYDSSTSKNGTELIVHQSNHSYPAYVVTYTADSSPGNPYANPTLFHSLVKAYDPANADLGCIHWRSERDQLEARVHELEGRCAQQDAEIAALRKELAARRDIEQRVQYPVEGAGGRVSFAAARAVLAVADATGELVWAEGGEALLQNVAPESVLRIARQVSAAARAPPADDDASAKLRQLRAGVGGGAGELDDGLLRDILHAEGGDVRKAALKVRELLGLPPLDALDVPGEAELAAYRRGEHSPSPPPGGEPGPLELYAKRGVEAEHALLLADPTPLIYDPSTARRLFPLCPRPADADRRALSTPEAMSLIRISFELLLTACGLRLRLPAPGAPGFAVVPAAAAEWGGAAEAAAAAAPLCRALMSVGDLGFEHLKLPLLRALAAHDATRGLAAGVLCGTLRRDDAQLQAIRGELLLIGGGSPPVLPLLP